MALDSIKCFYMLGAAFLDVHWYVGMPLVVWGRLGMTLYDPYMTVVYDVKTLPEDDIFDFFWGLPHSKFRKLFGFGQHT